MSLAFAYAEGRSLCDSGDTVFPNHSSSRNRILVRCRYTMVNLAHLTPPGEQPAPNHMSDGSELFPFLWRYFLHHDPLRDWLMRSEPFCTTAVSPVKVAQGIAFCCNFSVPPQWEDMSESFDMGEMFVPSHAYSHFMCGTVVAATSYHKHLICALGPAAARDAHVLPSYQTNVRRMVVDMGSSRSINIIEFSWMNDGALIVTVKILVPPDPAFPVRAAGCTGAFALFTDVFPAGPTPLVPRSLVSFIEVPRCPVCIASGSLGCYCSHQALERFAQYKDERSSAVWPPRLVQDVQIAGIDTYHNIRSRLDMIQHISHVKVTAHVVTGQDVMQEMGPPARTYKLGPSRFVIRAVLFRPATGYEADSLRQVADGFRLVRSGSLKATRALQELEHARYEVAEAGVEEQFEDKPEQSTQDDPHEWKGAKITDETIAPPVEMFDLQKRHPREYETVISGRSSHVSSACLACENPVPIDGIVSHTCSRARSFGFSAVSGSKAGNALLPGSLVTEELSDHSFLTKKISCPLCGKSFSQQGSLNRHLKNVHQEKKILCQFCNLAFGQMFDLKVSRAASCVTPTGEKLVMRVVGCE